MKKEIEGHQLVEKNFLIKRQDDDKEIAMSRYDIIYGKN